MSRLGVRHYSRLLKSKFKNCQVAERRVQIMWNSTDQKSGPKAHKNI